ncbi:MAG: dynamin family protein [Clostridium sp.]
MTKIKNNFVAKTNDFFREDRKLNIGVIGQVKAGKSSFLNTMIFNGMEVLPKAATPKTATLTKIEYSDKNLIEVEYYNAEEWRVLEENSTIDSQLNEYVVAKEIISMVRKNNINPSTYLEKGRECIEFESEADLMNELNNYIGEDGKITPLVKYVKLNVCKEELKEISIVDTPGLNDPIASRTDKTKQFIEMCDVVFFLSRASGFLDKSDTDLLAAQLPQKGAKRLVFICSRYDDGLVDTIYDKDSLKEADIDTKYRLKRHASKTFDRIIAEAKNRQATDELIGILSECKKPIFVSAMAHNMAYKKCEDYSEEEEIVYSNLNYYDEINEDLLREIGNIEEVKEIFEQVIEEKDNTLLKKSQTFIPDARSELEYELNNIKKTIEQRKELLTNNDKEQLLNKKKELSSHINNIRSKVEMIFGEMDVKLEQCKGEALRELRDASKTYSDLSEKSGSETKIKSYSVSTSKWYNPFSWGSSRTEYYSYEERYYYLDTADALENIRNFAKSSATLIEEVFYKSVDIQGLKRKLLNIIIEEVDTSDENYDAAYFKLLAEKTLNNIELPTIKIDSSKFINDISTQFSGEIRNSTEKSNLKSILSNTVGILFDKITEEFIMEQKRFKKVLQPIKENFLDNLLESINSEFSVILEQYESKENEIRKYEKIHSLIVKEMS